MANVGIFCGTAGGTSMSIAKALAKEYDVEEIINMEDDFDGIDQFEEFDVLFIGSSTWGQGDVHHSWVDPILEMESEGIYPYRDWETDRKSTRLNSIHITRSRMPSSA